MQLCFALFVFVVLDIHGALRGLCGLDRARIGHDANLFEQNTLTIRSKVRIRSVASPMGRRYIQFSDGVLQSRLTLRVAVCD